MAVRDDYQDFKNALNDLKMNNKSSINFLTLLAEDKVHHAQQIVRAIEERILETRGDYVLPALYVLDSIVKNLNASAYIKLFEHKLPVVFANAFNKVDERTRLSMFKLRQTWPPFFSNAVLHDLDTRTHYIDPAWPITARVPDTSPSAPKIHINPDFVQRNPTSSTSLAQQGKSTTNTGEPIRTTKEDNNNYHMIPIDRKEVDNHSIKPNTDEQQVKNKQTTNVNEKSSENEDDDLFCGTDIDYRDTENSQPSIVPNTDTDRLFKLNSECLSLAEEKFKSKELSSEEYQATLKLLQTILQNEVQRLTVPSTNSTTTTTSSFPTPPLSFPTNTTTTTASTLPNFPLTGFGNDTQRHALQILAAANATSSYAMPYNFLPFLPPLPPAPAPPPFTLAATALPSADRLSPNKKRTPDDNSNSNVHSDQMNKRQRRDSLTSTHGHNFDEENIAPVPPLVDANINTLKKKYLGVIQQLYIGKYQCRLCGLRFTAKQKDVYKHHLDWHYWENRQAATNQTNLLESCRDWYPSLQEWIVHEQNLDDQIKANQMMLTQNRQTKQSENQTSSSSEIMSCSAKGDGDVDSDRCYVCHDPFENFFDDNREEWRLKDAIRVDGKTYHPICYQDVQFHDTNEISSTLSTKDSGLLPESLNDDSSNQSSDSQLVDNVLSSVNIKQENDETNDKESLSSPEDSNKADYVSSMSFVNLVETIFIKKEDLKPIENFDDVKLNVKEELIDPTTRNQDIPFLSIKPENDCEFFNNQTSSDEFRSITE